MKVLINGSSYSVKESCSLDSLIKNLELDGKYAIEINQNIIPRSQYSTKQVSNGDKIEIVKDIGGGYINIYLPKRYT